MATKSRSKTQGLHYVAYKAQGKQAANRKRKLLKLQKEQPNNEQVTKALANIKYRRYTPKVQHWSHSAIEKVMLFKTFEKGINQEFDSSAYKHMDAIKKRAHYKGVPIWPNS